MQRSIILSAIVCCFLGLPLAVAAQKPSTASKTTAPKTTAATNPAMSPTETELLNEINQVRANPTKYIAYLEGLKPFFKGKEYRNGKMALLTEEGWGAVEDAIKFLRTAKPQPALTVSPGLCKAALAHLKEQSGSGATGHKGADRTMVEDRVKPYGTWDGAIGENLSYGDESARDRVLTWLTDDGFATRGHRKRILSPDYKVTGLSCGPHPEYGTMCVVTLAGGFSDVKPAKTAPVKANHNKPTKKNAP